MGSLSRLDFRNSTKLSDARLLALIGDALEGWSVGDVVVRIRYSRGADYSGTCFYSDRRIFVNLGRHLKYPYRMDTNLAKARSNGNQWRRPIYVIELRDPYEVVLFVFMHELYHLLIYRARRNLRQKESMCDRFAACRLVDRFGARVCDPKGRAVRRGDWDFQDLDRFVAAARGRGWRRSAACRAVRNKGAGGQLLLFPA